MTVIRILVDEKYGMMIACQFGLSNVQGNETYRPRSVGKILVTSVDGDRWWVKLNDWTSVSYLHAIGIRDGWTCLENYLGARDAVRGWSSSPRRVIDDPSTRL
jgi:hypothetical protein